jgi:hypothetical protein
MRSRCWSLPASRDQRIEDLLDGALLDVIEQLRFDVLITMDTSMQFQNQLSGRSFGVILLRAKSNNIKDLSLSSQPYGWR